MFSKSKPAPLFPNKSSEEIETLLAGRFEAAVDLSSSPVVTPEEVLSLSKPTTGYLCPKSANVYNIEFTKFRVRDFSNAAAQPDQARPILIDIQKPDDYTPSPAEQADPSSGRFVRYHLHSEFLNLTTLGAQITFTISHPKVVRDFRMIERHYFQDQLIKSFNFDFGAALIPNSENSIERIYELPKLEEKLKAGMVDFPWATKSDSFYFVEGRLVMHNKAEYAYNYEG